MIIRLYQAFLDLLFPPSCRNCGADGSWLCTACLSKCGPSVDCTAPIRNVDRLLCIGAYDTNEALKRTIQQLKYSGGRVLSATLGTALGRLAQDVIMADCIVPVPLHKNRERKRGFNQARLIADSAAQVLNLPVIQPIVRTKNTKPQVTLHEHERAMNVAQAFALARNIANVPKCGIIIDDVFTTGATISEVAGVLRSAGMEHVTALTIAKG